MKNLEIGKWYYLMMGYGGSESQYCCILRKTGRQTPNGAMSLFGGENGGIRRLPVCDIYIALDEVGHEHTVSANDLVDNGRIGIGSLKEIPEHRAYLCREDARLLVDTGRYTEEEIKAEFPLSLLPFGESDGKVLPPAPMNERQAEIFRAVSEARIEKERKETERKNEEFRKMVDKARARYSYIPCPKTEGKYLRTGEVSRNLRSVLKHEFSGVKFSVTSDSYSGGDSATVRWVDGPSKNKVEPIVDAFQTERHNVYEDYWSSETTATSVVCGGFSFTHAYREYEPSTRKYAVDFFRNHFKDEPDGMSETRALTLLARTSFPVCGYEIEGIEWDDEKGEYVMKVKPLSKAEPTPPTDNGGNGVTITHNEAKGGIEIRFPAIPSEKIRSLCKECGFRWSKFSKCWWAKMSDRTLAAAEQIVAAWNTENGKEAA